MSLQVWMPLIKDYENYGLSDLKFANFRYIRFVVNTIKGGSDSYTQLSRLEFLDAEGNLFKYPAGTTVSSSMTGYPASEPPASIIDGNVNTKFCAPWSAGGYLTIALGGSETIDISRYSRFQWYTANDGEWRDPISFEVQFSNDGVNFVKGAVVTNASITSTRFALAYTGNCFTASAGKIGSSCYYNNSYELGGLSSDKKINLGNKLSMCCWVNFSALTPNSALGGSMGGQHRYPNCTGMGLTIKYVSSSTGYLSCNTGDGNGNRTYNTYCGNTLLSAGTWYHVTFTYDGSTIKFYVNGNLDGTHSYTGQKNVEDYVFLGAWSFESSSDNPTVYGQYKLNGCINDFRIYDHVLSLKEIKTISQGLVAHYQLKGMGATNYLKGAGKFLKDTPLIRNASDVSHMNDSYVYHEWSPNDIFAVLPSAGTYTISVESDGVGAAHPTSGTTASQRLFSFFLQNTSTGDHYHFAMSKGTDGRWYSTRTDLVAGTYKVRTNLYAADNVNYTVKFWNMKVTAGSYSPSDTWCPYSEDELYNSLHLGLVAGIDCSGYGNHASIAGSITADTNTPRYSNSSCFNSGAYLKPPSMSFAGMANSYTFSYWAKIDDMSGKMVWGFMDGNRLNVYPSSWFNWNTGDSADNPFMSSGTNVAFTPYNGGWHHYAITGNGSTTTLYIDGKAVGTAKAYKPLTGTQLVISGWDTSDSYKWNGGSIVDYRIYATCLSSSNVMDLYNASASVAKDGTLFAYDFHENKRNIIDKSGIVATNGFNDRAVPTYDMKLTTLDDGSVWGRIHYLDLTYDKTFFANASEVAKCTDKHNRYSRMGDVDKFKSQPSLPAGYTELEYVKSTGTQWINTGAIIGSNTWVDTNLMFDDAFSYNMMFGSWTDSFAVSLRGTNIVCVAVGAASSQDIGSTTSVGVRYNIILGPGKGYVQNGVTFPLGGSSNASSGRTILLFGASAYAEDVPHQWVSFGVGKIYSFKIYNGITGDPASSILVRDFVPCKNPSGTVGMYDLVEKKFYGNSGSGTFTGGDFVSKYEFMLTYPSLSNTGYNRWTQTSSPNATSVSGYNPISISWPAHSAGIRKHGSSCVYNCDSGGTWYAPIGQTQIWEGGIPAADGTPQSITELWVRIDKSAETTEMKIYNGSIIAADYFEI